MKKILTLSCMIILVAPALHAQSHRHEINAGVGLWSSNQIINALSDVIVTAVPIGVAVKNSVSYGAWHAAYRYNLTSRFSLGGVLAVDYNTSDGYFHNVKTGVFNSYYYTLAAEATFHYVQTAVVQLYATAGAGASLYDQKYTADGSGRRESDSLLFFNFQATPIGIKIGKAVGGFAELGVGYKGIVSAGVFARF